MQPFGNSALLQIWGQPHIVTHRHTAQIGFDAALITMALFFEPSGATVFGCLTNGFDLRSIRHLCGAKKPVSRKEGPRWGAAAARRGVSACVAWDEVGRSGLLKAGRGQHHIRIC